MSDTSALRPRLYLHLTLIALALASCAQQPGKQAPPAPAAAGSKAASDADALAAQTQEQARRLNEALAHNASPTSPREVVWVDPAGAPKTKSAPPSPAQANPAAIVVNDAPTEQAKPSPAAAAKLDRQALLTRLLEDVRGGHDPAMVKALSAAALTLLDPSRPMDPADLSPLTPAQREQVVKYQQMVALAARQIAAGKTAGPTDDIADQLNQMLGEQPVHIRTAQLCKKVSGYGVYDPFESSSFLAGREQPLIVYVELDHFRSVKDAQGQQQVKLSQEIVLYNEADGLAVWRQPTTEILDQSRNRRRDFFVVQLVRLPARLSVGKYGLKIRITDLQGSSLDETTLPLQIVADQAMVSRGSK